MSIASFTLIRNEISWIGPHLIAWLPFMDEMCFLDGNSTDGTLETIELVKNNHPLGHKIILVKDSDPKDLQDDYVRLFNHAISLLKSDYAWFLHPDMFPVSGAQNLSKLEGGLAFITHMHSYAGEPGEQMYYIDAGRAESWKNIMRLHNPNLGLHYFGHYGAANEDTYFKDITGADHDHFGEKISLYPYFVEDSECHIAHLSDVRPYARRLSRMISCLENQGLPEQAKELAPQHPRVTLKSGKTQFGNFSFVPCKAPMEYTIAVREFHMFKETTKDVAYA